MDDFKTQLAVGLSFELLEAWHNRDFKLNYRTNRGDFKSNWHFDIDGRSFRSSIGRFIKRYIKADISDIELTKAVAIIETNREQIMSGTNLREATGYDISRVYVSHECRSCMTYYEEQTMLYALCSEVRLLYTGKARALLWEKDGVYYLDRIYGVDTASKEVFKSVVQEHYPDVVFRVHNTAPNVDTENLWGAKLRFKVYYNSPSISPEYDIESFEDKMEDICIEHITIPYLDTVRYVHEKTDTYIVIGTEPEDIVGICTDTEGSYYPAFVCSECGRISRGTSRHLSLCNKCYEERYVRRLGYYGTRLPLEGNIPVRIITLTSGLLLRHFNLRVMSSVDNIKYLMSIEGALTSNVQDVGVLKTADGYYLLDDATRLLFGITRLNKTHIPLLQVLWEHQGFDPITRYKAWARETNWSVLYDSTVGFCASRTFSWGTCASWAIKLTDPIFLQAFIAHLKGDAILNTSKKVLTALGVHITPPPRKEKTLLDVIRTASQKATAVDRGVSTGDISTTSIWGRSSEDPEVPRLYHSAQYATARDVFTGRSISEYPDAPSLYHFAQCDTTEEE